MKTVGVFFGGRSNEREISVITGMLAVNLLWEKCNVVPVYWADDGFYSSKSMRAVSDFSNFHEKDFPAVELNGRDLVLKKKRKKVVATLDCALNCCHGGAGEDGTLSAVLRFHGVPLASPDTAVSAVFMQKTLGKIAARGLHVPVLESFSVSERDWKDSPAGVLAKAEELGYPVIVKPSALGSSVGIRVAKNETELLDALDFSFRLDKSVLVEKYLEGKRDVNCAVYRKDGEIVLSPLEEVFSSQEFLSFSEKYEGAGERTSQIPAELEEETAEKIRACARLIYESFSVRGVVRFDFLVSGKEVYFNELNTVPGSLACYLFGESLTAAREFLLSLVNEAHAEEEKLVLQSGILNKGVFSGGKSAKRRF